ncbi:MAG: cytochrome c maturation protein CcmE [Actinomycetota bacterium]
MMATSRKKTTTLVLGAVGVLAGLGGLMAVALGGSTVSTVPFAEVTKAKDKVEIFGVLDKRSIRQIRGANLVSFDLLEEQGDEKKTLTGRRIAVLYQNHAVGLPANFPAGSHARAAGLYDPSSKKLVSDRVYTKCPSKYKEDGLDPATKIALKEWKSGLDADKPGAGALAVPAGGGLAPQSQFPKSQTL